MNTRRCTTLAPSNSSVAALKEVANRPGATVTFSTTSTSHTGFGKLAVAGGLNWSDLVHWSIYYNAKDPDHVVVTEDTGCRDRLLYFHDKNGHLVWKQRFKLIYSANDGRVVSAYPSTTICKR